MRTFGHIDMQQNELQQAVLSVENNFPEFPKVGRLTFKDKRLYICAEVQDGVPVWIPLTNEISTFIHHQNFLSDVWVLNHNLNTTSPVVQVYDGLDQRMVHPDNIIPINNNRLEVYFGRAITGRAIVMAGQEDGLVREQGSFEHFQKDLATTWTINHGLGYYPMTRIFIGMNEVIPAAIQHPDVFTTVVKFTEPQLGLARLL